MSINLCLAPPLSLSFSSLIFTCMFIYRTRVAAGGGGAALGMAFGAESPKK